MATSMLGNKIYCHWDGEIFGKERIEQGYHRNTKLCYFSKAEAERAAGKQWGVFYCKLSNCWHLCKKKTHGKKTSRIKVKRKNRTAKMDKYLPHNERLEKVVEWLRGILRNHDGIWTQLLAIDTACAKWRVDKVKAREALKDILYEPKTEEERLYASDLWFREKVWVPKKRGF